MNKTTQRSEIFCKIDIPSNFRVKDFLQFHGRDPFMVTERIDENSIEIGILIENHPSCLIISFSPRLVEAALVVDGVLQNFNENDLSRLVQRFLGISQNVQFFEEEYCDHPQLKVCISIKPGLRMPIAITPYAAFTRAIFSQQISTAVALGIRRKFIMKFGKAHSSGIMCYPEPADVAQSSEEQVKSVGCSAAKTRTILEVSQRIVQGVLPVNEWLHCEYYEEMRNSLLDIKGVGPWTADSTLMHGYGFLDRSLHNDLGIRKKLQILLHSSQTPSAGGAEVWLSQFSPWRTLVAVHLWSM